ncbi:MAG: ABC transporter substrate-binding protein [Azospirillaceae bacterium]
MTGLYRKSLLAAVAAITLAPALAGAQMTDLVVGATLEPPSLDPTTTAAAAVDEVTYHNIFEGLTMVNENGEVIPGLAESWDISDDGLTYTFHLLDGVMFADGTEFDAEDVVFTFERLIGEESVSAKASLFAAIESVEAVDPRTVRFTLSRQEGLLLFNLGGGDAAVVNEESIDQIATDPMGTGPYVIGDRVEGDRLTLVRNPHYRDPDGVYFDTVTFRYITDPAAQTAAVLSGDVHYFTNIGAPESLAAFEADDRYEVVVGTTEGETVMSANWRREPFDNPLVRQAIAHAIDRQGIVDSAMFGYGIPIGTHFAPHNPDYLDLTGLYPYDPDRARELLAEAGYPDGFSTTFILPPPTYSRRGGEVIQAYLAEVGIEAELIPVEWAQWLEGAYGANDYDLTVVSHTEANDIGIYARGPEDYYFGYDNAEFNAVIEELAGETDPARRTELNHQAQRMIGEDLATIFLFQLPQLGVRDARLQGIWANRPIQANDITGAYWEE